MKILWCTWKDRKNPASGGAEVVNEEIAKRLARDGHEVIFLVGGFKGNGAHGGEALAGNRHLVYVGFYCSPPPSFLTHGNQEERNRYIKQMQYLSEVAKLQGVTMKYGTVNGVRGSLQEKNLDTQLVADMVTMAAKNQFDVAVLVSNDGDYVSAIRPTKESFGKKVEVLYFRHHASMALRQECDLTRKARLAFFRRLPSLPSVSGQPKLLP